MTALSEAPRGEVQAAVRATYAAFISTGFAFASWASRIPQVKDRLGLSPSGLGLVLLAIAAGSVIALPLSGPVVTRFGSRRTVAGDVRARRALGLVVVAVGYRVGVAPVVAGLFAFGVGDRQLGRRDERPGRARRAAPRPRDHAPLPRRVQRRHRRRRARSARRWSPSGSAVTAHLAVIGVARRGRRPARRARLHPRPGRPEEDATRGAAAARVARGVARAAHLLIGVFVLAFAFAEGAGNDWIGVALIDDHGAAPAVGTLGFAVFLAAMTAGRWFGPWALDRYGRVPVDPRAGRRRRRRPGAVLRSARARPSRSPARCCGASGISLGFPVGMSAGADDPARAAARVSVVSSIGYCAFLAGPPLIGFLGAAARPCCTRSPR